MKMKKIIAAAILLLLLIAAAVYLLQRQHQVLSGALPPTAWAVTVEDRILNDGEVRLTRPAVADVVAMEQTVLSSRLSGYITRMPLFEGSRFKRGDVLATIEMSQSGGGQSQGNSLKADLAAAESSLLAEQERLQRTRKLYQIGGVALEQLQVAEAALAAAQARAAVARENVRNTILLASFDGVVAERLAQPGDIATPGKPLLRVVALGSQRVLVDVPETTVVSGLQLSGKTYSVHPWPQATGQGLRRWEARVADLMPGSKVEVDIVSYAGKGVFIPSDCMLNNDGRHADLVRLPTDATAPASVQRIDLLASGIQGAVAIPGTLTGARVACSSPDVLNRLAGGTPYTLSGAH
ncbi:MAG: efflux RND transporter periplasmic adaptor subunit [Sideroxyarcus sp.]|nr:efflux RND transporter periplasmic adaptor subunit [Sideroxyarcus sp.]